MRARLILGGCAGVLSLTISSVFARPDAVTPIDPYSARAVATDTSLQRPAIVYEPSHPPPTPPLDALPLKAQISQYGIT